MFVYHKRQLKYNRTHDTRSKLCNLSYTLTMQNCQEPRLYAYNRMQK